MKNDNDYDKNEDYKLLKNIANLFKICIQVNDNIQISNN